MGVKHFGCDCPCSVFLQQRELISEAVAEPAIDLNPRGSDSVSQINVDDSGFQIRGWRVFSNPVEQDVDRSREQAATQISVDRGVFAKRGFHDRSIALAPALCISTFEQCNLLNLPFVGRGL